MIKRLLLIFALCVSLPAFAGVFEDALKTGNNVFLYLYTQECKYCNEFNPVYQRLAKNYGNRCSFVKVNAATPYGLGLIKRFRTRYVPFVVVADKKDNSYVNISVNCLLDYVCAEKSLKKIIN